MVGIEASAGSAFMAATMPMGSVRGLLRSRMTSEGGSACIAANALADDRANDTWTPTCVAVVLIFELNIKSSRIARITS